MAAPPLPPGFTLDAQPNETPPLPPGFSLDSGPVAGEAEQQPFNATPMQAIAETAATMGTGAVATAAGGLAGLASAPFVGMDRAADIVRNVQDRFTYQPRSDAAQRIAGVVAIPGALLERGADAVGQRAATSTGSPAAGAAVNTAIQSIPGAVLGPILGRGRIGNGRSVPNRPGSPVAARAPETAASPAGSQGQWAPRLERVPEPAKVAAPTIDELAALKNAAYQQAESTGVVISRGALNRLKVDLVNDLKKEGLNRTLHPKTQAALKEILDTKGQLSLTQVETLRKIANDAKGAIEPADSRLGARIVKKIDEFEKTLGDADVISGDAAAATAFEEARALNTRLSKARIIDNIFKDVEVRAGANYTTAGAETALRQAFKSLATNKSKMRQFDAEETAAIRKVAIGGPVENVLRKIGKFSPDGGAIANTANMVAVMAAGPAGAALPAAGAVSKFASGRMTRANAMEVDRLMRAGPQRPAGTPRRNALIEQ